MEAVLIQFKSLWEQPRYYVFVCAGDFGQASKFGYWDMHIIYILHKNCQKILSIVKGNDKNAIVDALISPNNNLWPHFTMHPLQINMHLAEVAAALLSRDQEFSNNKWQQLEYAEMLINISQSWNSTWCEIVETIDDNTAKIGFLHLEYITKSNQLHNKNALNWLYLNQYLSFYETILCSNNESIDKWNAVAQERNINDEHRLLSRDAFEEVNDPNGHIKKC